MGRPGARLDVQQAGAVHLRREEIAISRITWDPIAGRAYETGLDRGVFYPKDGPGLPWNGLTAVVENESNSDERTRYIDGVKTRTRRRPGEFEGRIEAFTYPETFHTKGLLDKRPRPFDLCYRVQTDTSYRLHLVYNVRLGVDAHLYEQKDAVPFAWDFTTVAVPFPGLTASAHFVIEADIAYSETLVALEDVLYGNEVYDAALPNPVGIFQIFEEHSILQIIDHGDGTWTAIGPDDVVQMLDATTFQIDWPSAVMINPYTYTVHSL